jgi:hypothetical protein
LRAAAGADAAAVVLRPVAAREPCPDARAVQVFLLPPTGDLFRLADGGLHWHHICTVAGVRLLPGAADAALMTALRARGADGAERAAYEREARSFCAFARAEMARGGAEGE